MFKRFYNVIYQNFEGSTANYPQEIMEGGTLDVTFTGFVPDHISVKINDEKKVHKYSDGHLIVEDITGDVVVKYILNALYDLVAKQSIGDDANVTFGNNGGGTTIDSGVFEHLETKDEEFPVYYYRGDVEDNYAFYAGYCWRILRTTTTGGVKLVFDGTKHSSGTKGCREPGDGGSGMLLPEKVGFNETDEALSDAYYMYGDRYPRTYWGGAVDGQLVPIGTVFGKDVTYDASSNTYTLVDEMKSTTNGDKMEYEINMHHYTCLSFDNQCVGSVYYVYTAHHDEIYFITLSDGVDIETAMERMAVNPTDEHSSVIKTYIEGWYKDTLLDTYDKDIEDTVYCNDRNFDGFGGYDKNLDNGDGDNTKIFFAGYNRFVKDVDNPSRPTLACSPEDSFTVDKANGNGELNYKIGLLTADEVMLAGATIDTDNPTYFLNVGSGYWVMTPYYASDNHNRSFRVSSNGGLSNDHVETVYRARPVISLKMGANYSSGTGTATDPYILFVDE